MSNKINPPHGLESFFSLVDLVSETIAFLLKKKNITIIFLINFQYLILQPIHNAILTPN